jgi:catechol 2,3-dioxygenase-like lactoylglutathione lyase family enzyme
MSHRGISHIGLSTLNLDKTREFYEGVLGFKAVSQTRLSQRRRAPPTPLF